MGPKNPNAWIRDSINDKGEVVSLTVGSVTKVINSAVKPGPQDRANMEIVKAALRSGALDEFAPPIPGEEITITMVMRYTWKEPLQDIGEA